MTKQPKINKPINSSASNGSSNIQISGDKQIINIEAKGGYSPKSTQAKANMNTEIHVNTNGTVDCSSSLMIKDIGYSGNLKPTGLEKIQVKPQAKGTAMVGMCSFQYII